MKTRPFSMVYQGKVQYGLELLIRYMYDSGPVVGTEALVKLIGINTNGETTIGTAKLLMPTSMENKYVERLYRSITDKAMYTSVRVEVDTSTNTCVTLALVDKITFIGFTSDITDNDAIAFE